MLFVIQNQKIQIKIAKYVTYDNFIRNILQ